MKLAKYVTPESTSLISVNDINSRKTYINKYVGKLFCPTENCHAQLDYVELHYRNNDKIFRTHKGSNHVDSCPHNILHTNSSSPTFSAETFSQEISESHIKSILKGLYQRNVNPLATTTPAPKKSVSKHRKHSNAQTAPHAIASIDPDAEPVKNGNREPSVWKRRSQDLLIEDNNKLRGIDGTIDRAYVCEDYIELFFSNTDIPVTLLFYTAFRAQSEQAYHYVATLANLLNSTDLKVLVCCLGVVEITGTKAIIQVMSPDLITFEGMSITSYIMLKNN